MTTRDIAFINPPNPSNLKGFPGSLLALELWIRKKLPHIRTGILNEENTPLEQISYSLETKLSTFSSAPYIGITATTATYQDALATARAAKKVKPDSLVILGGHHIDGQEKTILTYHPEIDYTITGEGENALEALLLGNTLAPGITSRTSTAPSRRGIPLTSKELNNLDIREFDPHYSSVQFEENNLVTARGCPQTCSFCAVADQDITAQDPALVVEQIDFLVQANQAAGRKPMIAIQDNFFAKSKQRAYDIAQRLKTYRNKTGNDFEWNMQTRVEQLTDSKLVALLAESGCSAVYLGIENFDTRMLRTLHKAHHPQRYLTTTLTALQNCTTYGIQPHIDFQVGIPGEDQQTETINEAALSRLGEIPQHKTPIIFPSLSVVYPATGFYQRMMQLGAPADIFEHFTQWERENQSYRAALAGYFAHGNGGIPLGILDTEELGNGKLHIQEKELSRVKQYVNKLRSISGIRVFDYTNKTRE